MRNLATVLVTDKESGQSAEVQLDELTKVTNSVVMLSVGPDGIASIEAQSGDLLITLNSGEAIIIAGFFDTPEGERNELVLEDANGILWWGQYDSPWSEFSFAEINLLDEAAKDQEIGWWLIAAGLGGAAAIAAAAGGGGSSSSSPSRPEEDTTPPDAPSAWFNETGDAVSGEAEPGSTVIVRDEDGNELGRTTADEDGSYTIELDEPLTNGEEVEVTATDEAGNESEPTTATAPDTTAPDAPSAEFNDTGDAVSGEAEPGSTVIVRDADGNELGRTTADEDGSYTVELDEPLTNGEEVEVTATDEVGNESEPTTATAPDTTAPDAPTAKINDGDEDISAADAAIGSATWRDEDGNELGRTTADEDGSYTVELDEPLTNGEEVEVTATDEAGNESEPTTAAAPDTTAPDAPTVTIGDGDEYISAAEIDEDGNVTVTIALPGDAKAGDTLTVNGDEIELTEAHLTAGEVVTQVAAPAEGETLEVTATVTDAAGNESEPGTASATVDTTAPDLNANSIAFVDPNSDGWINADEVGGVELVGQLDADDDVTITSIVITDVDGGSVTIDADDITITDGVISVAGQDLSNLADGELTVTMTVTDAACNSAELTDTITLDATAPEAPTLALADDTSGGDGITSDGTVSVDGLEEGATWQYSTDGGDTWLDGEGDSFVLLDGEYAEGDVLARQTDSAGNTSDDGVLETAVTVVGSTPTITISAISGDDVLNLSESEEELTISGTTTGVENGQTVTVSLNGETYTGEVTGNTWSVTVPVGDLQALGDGETYPVTADVANAAGTDADQASRDLDTDFTSPGGEDGTDAPVLTITDAEDGFINAEELDGGIEAVVELTEGTQEGDTVTVTLTDAEGVEHSFEHTVTADDLTEGEVSLTLDGDFAEGDASAVAVITDEAGNSSADSNAVAFEIDTVAPDAPTLELANDTGDVDGVTSDGTVNVGGLEENATWEYSTDGGASWTEGTGDSFVLPEGDYEESDVLARQTDEAGNTSGNGELGAVTVDTTSPGGDDGTDAPVLAIADADNGFINADELADGIQAVVTLTDGTQEGDTVTVTLTDAEGEIGRAHV